MPVKPSEKEEEYFAAHGTRKKQGDARRREQGTWRREKETIEGECAERVRNR
jgi:hypothetical protein